MNKKDIRQIFAEGLLDDTTPQFKARQRIVNMPIDDFLRLATPLNEEHSSRAREALQKGIRWSDLPYLQFDEYDDETHKVYGHEGRHRARVLKELGYTHMPVEMRSRNIRWSEQAKPNSYDYVKNFPKYLMEEGEGRTGKIPFPFTREEAPLPTKSLEQAYQNTVKNKKPYVVVKANFTPKSAIKVKPPTKIPTSLVDVALSLYDFFANPMVADAPTIPKPKPKPKPNIFIAPESVKNNSMYDKFKNATNRQT